MGARTQPKSGRGSKADALDRRHQAFNLQIEGNTYRQIAKIMGITEPRAWVLVDQYCKAQLKTDQGLMVKRRTTMLGRLDLMLRSIWLSALGKPELKNEQGDVVQDAVPPSTKAMDRVLSIMEREAKLLGLDAPARVDIEHRLRAMAEAEGLNVDEVLAEAGSVIAEFSQ